MNLGFLILRNGFLKTTGCLIDACLKNDHDVFILYQPDANVGVKSYQNVSLETLPTFESSHPKFIRYHPGILEPLCDRYKIDVLVTHEGYAYFKDSGLLEALTRLRKAGTKFVSLGNFFEIAQRPLEALEYLDKTFYISEFGRDLHFAIQVGSGSEKRTQAKSRYADNYEVAGSPMFDQIGRANADEVRAEYRIRNGKRIVLLIAPVLSFSHRWRFVVWRYPNRIKRSLLALFTRKLEYLGEIWSGHSFKDVVAAIRDFCNRNDALLVVKSRGKQKDPQYLKQTADIFVDGFHEEYYPVFTTYRLLAMANLCITMASMTAIEAVVASVPVLNIYVPHLDYHPATNLYQQYMEAIFNNRELTPFNYPGCVHTIDRREVVNWLRGRDLKDIPLDPPARQRYIEKYAGVTSRSSNQRILESIEKLVTG